MKKLLVPAFSLLASGLMVLWSAPILPSIGQGLPNPTPYDFPLVISTELAQSILSGGVTPESNPSASELQGLKDIGTKRLRLINVDIHKVIVKDNTVAVTEWGPKLLKELQYCKDYQWIPRIIIGQRLPSAFVDTTNVNWRSGPNSWDLYDQYVTLILDFVINQWGFSESEWEVGNEMNLPNQNWTSSSKLTQISDPQGFTTYIQLYRHISDVVRQFKLNNPTAKVRLGGPASAFIVGKENSDQTSWVYKFVESCSQTEPGQSPLLCDFVSFHLYGNSISGNLLKDSIESINRRSSKSKLPVSISEWGASGIYKGESDINFSPVAGAFVFEFLRTLQKLDVRDAIFLALSEFPNSPIPVLFDKDSQPTHALQAMRLLSNLNQERFVCRTQVSSSRCIASLDSKTRHLKILFWNLDWDTKPLNTKHFEPNPQLGGPEQITLSLPQGFSVLPQALRIHEIEINGSNLQKNSSQMPSLLASTDPSSFLKVSGLSFKHGDYGAIELSLP